jgi:hypothetical protein
MYEALMSPVDQRRFHNSLYEGAIGLFSDLAEMHAIVSFTRAFLEDRFAPVCPPEIHRHVAPSQLADVLSGVQRDYARSESVKGLWRELFAAIGLDTAAIARDRLVLRFQPPTRDHSATWNRSTSTVGFHRDTWGTNLYSQINWWAPVYPLAVNRTFAFFPTLWDVPLRNNSLDFDMSEAMRRVRDARPGLKASDLLPQLLGTVDAVAAHPVTIEPGDLIAFSAQHAHAGVYNDSDLTRISFDTRTLWIDDFRAGRGAPNIDGFAHWMAPGMFQRISDGVSVSALLGLDKLHPYDGPRPIATDG